MYIKYIQGLCQSRLCTTVPSATTAVQVTWRTVSSVKVKVTLRLTISQSVSLGVEPPLGLLTRYLLLFDSYGLVHVGRSLWREDASVVYNCCWPWPAQSFSGPSPWDSRPYFTVSDLRLPISSPPTTRRVTVEVFDPASTRVSRTVSYCWLLVI
jgi:hypothetical protein